MPEDPFLNQVGRQLIEAPAASQQILASATQDVPPPVPPGAEFPIEQARSWLKMVLRDQYHPPPSAFFAALRKESGLCDVVRSRYQLGGFDFDVAQSRYILSLTIKQPKFVAAKSDEENATLLGRALFTLGDRVRLMNSGPYKQGHFGKQNLQSAGRIDEDWPHWLDTLRWWRSGGEMGFLFLKASGGPTRAVISVDQEANIKWFE